MVDGVASAAPFFLCTTLVVSVLHHLGGLYCCCLACLHVGHSYFVLQ